MFIRNIRSIENDQQTRSLHNEIRIHLLQAFPESVASEVAWQGSRDEVTSTLILRPAKVPSSATPGHKTYYFRERPALERGMNDTSPTNSYLRKYVESRKFDRYAGDIYISRSSSIGSERSWIVCIEYGICE